MLPELGRRFGSNKGERNWTEPAFSRKSSRSGPNGSMRNSSLDSTPVEDKAVLLIPGYWITSIWIPEDQLPTWPIQTELWRNPTKSGWMDTAHILGNWWRKTKPINGRKLEMSFWILKIDSERWNTPSLPRILPVEPSYLSIPIRHSTLYPIHWSEGPFWAEPLRTFHWSINRETWFLKLTSRREMGSCLR